MLKQYNRLLVFLFGTLDITLTLASVAFAYWLRFEAGFVTSRLPVEHGIPSFSHFFNLPICLTIAAVWTVVFKFHGLYQPRRGKSPVDEVFAIFRAVVLGTLILLALSFFQRQASYSRAVVFLFILTDFLFVSVMRVGIRLLLEYIRSRGYNQRQVVIAGAGILGQTLLEKIQIHPGAGLQVVGFVDDDPDLRGKLVRGVPILGNLDQVDEIFERRTFDLMYIALPVSSYERMYGLLDKLQKAPVSLKILPDILQYITFRAGLEDLDGIPIINLNETPMTGWTSLVKRGMDLVLAYTLLLLLSPLFAAMALLVKLTSRGPVFFRQERMGLDGKTFIMYKFRTMRTDAEKDGPGWTSKDDPRRTGVGAFLRQWSLDELPQLVNVIKGDMSLVGPRPERPAYVREFCNRIPNYMLRHKVRSGMTGWAQVNGLRGDCSIEERVEYDFYYIENWSLTLDLKILIMTLFHMRVNAY